MFDHFINKVLPLAETETVPQEAPLKWPAPPKLNDLGTTGDHVKSLIEGIEDEREQLKGDACEERETSVKVGRGDRWSEYQRVSKPKLTKTLIGFKIEFLWQYPGDDGEPYLDWAHGKIVKIKNKEKRLVEIRWADECVADGDADTTVERVADHLWNKASKGAWRQYLGTQCGEK